MVTPRTQENQERSSLPEHAEVIGDVEEGSQSSNGQLDELGLTAEERAIFDDMKAPDGDAQNPPETPPETPPEPETPAPDAKVPPVETPADDEDDAPTVVRDPKTGKEQKTINYGKHQRLMQKAQAAAETARQVAEQQRIDNAKIAERLAILNEALTAPPRQDPAATQEPQNPMQEPTIDPAEDAIGALAQMQRRQIYLAESANQAVEQTNERLEDHELINGFTRDVEAFSRSEMGKDFMGADGAYQYLKNTRLTEIAISLFDKDPTDPNERFTEAEVRKMVEDYNTEERWVASNALSKGKSPALAIMKLARNRGWRTPAEVAAQQAQHPGQTGAAALVPRERLQNPPAASAAAKVPASSAVAKLNAEREGAAASRSLSDGGGAPPQLELTMDALLKMGEEEFGRYVDNMPKERLDAIMGRPPVGERG